MIRHLQTYIAAILLIIGMSLSLPSKYYSKAKAASHFSVRAKAAILVDAKSGKILYRQNMDESLPVASMSKLMTQYLILEKIQKGGLHWGDVYHADAADQDLSTRPGLGNVPLYKGHSYTVRDLYNAMTLVSANAASRALGRMAGKSDRHFVQMMNDKAKKLGLKHSSFVNTSGLNNLDLAPYQVKGTASDGENKMSARDLALLAYHFVHSFPNELDIDRKEQAEFHVTNSYTVPLHNKNQLLPNGKYPYKGAIGMKTGMNDAAGYGIVALAKRGQREFIAVIIDAKNKKGKRSSKARYMQAQKLLDYGFAHWDYQKISPEKFLPTNQQKIPVEKGTKEKATVTSKTSVTELVPKNSHSIKAKLTLMPKFTTDQKKLKPPIKKGTVIGTISLQDGSYGYLTPKLEKIALTKATAKEEVKKENWFVSLMNEIF
jgi:D-alanyl-D-alanine carboxypeptidase (penicillin-binding protein 5/6)